MTMTEWLVIGGGLAVIVWLNWYFLFSDRSKGRNTPPSNRDSQSKPPE